MHAKASLRLTASADVSKERLLQRTGRGRGRHPLLGKTVTIGSGMEKGCLGTVLEVHDNVARVELQTKMKRISAEVKNLHVVGDTRFVIFTLPAPLALPTAPAARCCVALPHPPVPARCRVRPGVLIRCGAVGAQFAVSRSGGGDSDRLFNDRVDFQGRFPGGTTPMYGGGATPMYGGGATPMYGGGATPMYGGGATPMHGGSRTPMHEGGASAFQGGRTPAWNPGSQTPAWEPANRYGDRGHRAGHGSGVSRALTGAARCRWLWLGTTSGTAAATLALATPPRPAAGCRRWPATPPAPPAYVVSPNITYQASPGSSSFRFFR